MSHTNRTTRLLMLFVSLTPLFSAQMTMGQTTNELQINELQINELQITEHQINERKKAVVFIFGTIHPLNPDKTAITDTNGNRLAIDVPLGTGFFVGYQDPRAGVPRTFSYLITAKHVLRDVDGTFLPKITIRLNLKRSADDSGVGFISDIPVTDAQGSLLWLQSQNQAQDVAALPLSPDEGEFEFTTISTRMFLNEGAANSGDIAEGDDLYFIGLMEQYYGIKRNYPLVRRGTLALITDESIDTPMGPQKVYIAELESWPGNSGSPVFLLRGGHGSVADVNSYTFLGMLIASFLNKFTVLLNGAELEGGDKANIGMTCIVPAVVIREVLDSPSAQQEREARARMPPSVAK